MLKPLKKPTALPPLIKDKPKDEWRSAGVAEKPSGCAACKYSTIGTGFCGDDNPAGKRLAILCAAATKGEILEQIPWAGPQGWAYTKMFLDEAGIPRNEVLIAHVLRCRPPFQRTGSQTDSYPTGGNRRNAELSCRQYDESHTYRGVLSPGGIKTFAPDTFLVTFEPEKALEVTAYKRIIQEDIKKAWRLVQKGRRVCVLMGEPPFALLGEGLIEEGGVKTFRGHYWKANGWPYDAIKQTETKRFNPVSGTRPWRKG